MKNVMKFSELNIGDQFQWKSKELKKVSSRFARCGREDYLFYLHDLVIFRVPTPKVDLIRNVQNIDKLKDNNRVDEFTNNDYSFQKENKEKYIQFAIARRQGMLRFYINDEQSSFRKFYLLQTDKSKHYLFDMIMGMGTSIDKERFEDLLNPETFDMTALLSLIPDDYTIKYAQLVKDVSNFLYRSPYEKNEV